ncbi:YbjN domain-containing protein, partial [Bacteroides uniformis]|uniref:YbjN domain-containing protein n=2 Tax=Bacteroides TaxID=816 RepID=UPI001D0831B9
YIIYNEEGAWMRCHMSLPVKVPQEKREAVLWKINNFNYDNPGVCMSMDANDGEVVAVMLVNTDDGAINDRII